MALRRLALLALTALAAGGLASARSAPLSLQPSLAPAPQRSALPRVLPTPKPRAKTEPKPAPRVTVRAPQHVQLHVDPLRAFCRDAQRLRSGYESRRPPLGSPASVYLPFLAEGARLEAALVDRLTALGVAPTRFTALAARRVALARKLVDAAERRDAGSYSATSRALEANARAARAVSHAPGCVG